MTQDESEKRISVKDLRKVVRDGLIPIVEPESDMPKSPPGCPKQFADALMFDGVCSIPLKSKDVYRWYIFDNGGPVLKNGEWGKESSFGSFEEAMNFANDLIACGQLSSV